MDYSADISLPAGDAAERDRAKERLYVLFQAAGWGACFAIEAWTIIEFPEHEAIWGRTTTLAVTVMSFCTGILITHFMRPLMARWNWKELGWRALVPRLIAAAVVGATLWNAIEILWVHGFLGLP